MRNGAQDWGHDKFDRRIKHVLLVSIDGMHAVDYLSGSRGLSGVNDCARADAGYPEMRLGSQYVVAICGHICIY